MKNLLLASTLLAGAAAPWTLRSQDDPPIQFPATVQKPAQAKNGVMPTQPPTPAGESPFLRQTSGASSGAGGSGSAPEPVHPEELYLEQLELERAMVQMEQEYELETMQKSLELRLAAREAERRISQEIVVLERAAERFANEHEREIHLAEQQFEREEWAMLSEQEQAEELWKRKLEGLEQELERSSRLLQHQIDTGAIEESDGLAELNSLRALMEARQSQIFSNHQDQQGALQAQMIERAIHVEQERMQKERAMEEKQAQLQTQIDQLYWALEDSTDRSEVEREIDSLRRMVQYEARMHELDLRSNQIERQIRQTESKRNAPTLSTLQAPHQPQLDEVLDRLEHVENQVDKLWATIDKLHSGKHE